MLGDTLHLKNTIIVKQFKQKNMPNLELGNYMDLNPPQSVEPQGSVGTSGFNPLPYVGKAIQIGTGIWGQKKANEANMELQRRQNEWNLAQWQREMAYNTPKAQYERMKNSGLNPALMYKGQPQNTTKAPMSAPSPKMESITKNMPQLGQFMLMAQMQKAQIENLNAQTRNTEAETNLKDFTLMHINPEKVKQIVAQTQGQLNANQVSALEAKLAQSGMFKTDPKLLRATWTILEKAGKDPAQMSADIILKVYDFLNSTTTYPSGSTNMPAGLPIPNFLIPILNNIVNK